MAYLRESASFARPADTTAYAAGDLVANSTTAGSVVVPGLTLPRIGSAYIIRGGILEKSSATVANAAFNVHIFSGDTAVVPTAGDNAALVATQVVAANGGNVYRGALAFAAANWRSFSDRTVCIGLPLISGQPFIFIGASPAEITLELLIEATAAYAPASAETFTFTPWYEPVIGTEVV